jgi:hypothetical protein
VVVNTTISGGQLDQPVAVAWRVLGAQGSWKVVDVQFKGVWLAITQQQDFVSTIDNASGDIGVLIAQLRRDAQRPARPAGGRHIDPRGSSSVREQWAETGMGVAVIAVAASFLIYSLSVGGVGRREAPTT